MGDDARPAEGMTTNMAGEVDPSCNPLDLASQDACNPGSIYGVERETDDSSETMQNVESSSRSPNDSDFSSFDIVKATQYGALERCRELIEGGNYDINRRDSENVTLLHWAAINNRREIVKYYVS